MALRSFLPLSSLPSCLRNYKSEVSFKYCSSCLGRVLNRTYLEQDKNKIQLILADYIFLFIFATDTFDENFCLDVISNRMTLWNSPSKEKLCLLHFCCCCHLNGTVEGSELIFSSKNSQNYNSVLNNHERRMLGPIKKKSHLQGQRRTPRKMVGGETDA